MTTYYIKYTDIHNNITVYETTEDYRDERCIFDIRENRFFHMSNDWYTRPYAGNVSVYKDLYTKIDVLTLRELERMLFIYKL